MTIDEKIAAYREKLEKQALQKAEKNAAIIAACKAFIDAYNATEQALDASTKATFKPVLGRLAAFINGVPYCTRNRNGGSK